MSKFESLADYRPITALLILSKVYGKVTYQNKLLSYKYQSGYRKNDSTKALLLRRYR